MYCLALLLIPFPHVTEQPVQGDQSETSHPGLKIIWPINSYQSNNQKPHIKIQIITNQYNNNNKAPRWPIRDPSRNILTNNEMVSINIWHSTNQKSQINTQIITKNSITTIRHQIKQKWPIRDPSRKCFTKNETVSINLWQSTNQKSNPKSRHK